MKAKTIEIFLPTGNPLELEEASLTTSVIKIVHLNQSHLDDSKDRINQNGCYILYGKDDSEEELVYIGEADNVFKRLKDHKKKKLFWYEAYAIIHVGNRFDKANLHYLENLMIKETISANRYKIENANTGQENHTTESKAAESQIFFEDIRLSLHTLGLDIFKPKNAKINISDQNIFYYSNLKEGYESKAIYENDELTVLKGSKARLELNASVKEKLNKLKNKLILENIIVKENNYYIFTKDYTFNSPSSAASLMSGSSTNGWIAWKTNNGKTLDEIFRNKE